MHPDQIRALLEEQSPGGPSDNVEVSRIHSALSLLHVLPDLEPSPERWRRIQSALPRGTPGSPRSWVRSAVAACALFAIVSIAVVRMPQRAEALPVVLETGKALTAWNEPYTAPQFSTLLIPDVGTLRLNRDTSLRFESPRRVHLDSGELFADIRPSGKGFEIRSGDSIVRVKGTKFGVTAPATVYVVEGAVEVSTPRGHLSLGPRQTAVESRLVDIGVEDHLRWLAQYERPSVRLKLDPRDQMTVTPGAPLRWNLILETDALAPLALGRIRDVSQFFSLIVDGTARPIDASRVLVREARMGANGLVHLDVNHPCILECAVDPVIFHEKGPVSVRAVFTSGNPAAENLWEGIVRSQAVTVEIR